MNAVQELSQIIDLLYRHGWDERNGGNISYLISEEEAREICPCDKVLREFHYEDIDLSVLVGRYVMITGTGSYFKNTLAHPEVNLGIMKVSDKNTLQLVWGYSEGGRPTSEASTHLQCHVERLKVDPKHRIVMHCHPVNIISMTHILPPDTKVFTEIFWKMQTESIVVFPEGVAVLPWMLCGGTEIGIVTADLMKDYRSVIWAQHGIFCTGTSIDEVFGLIETIEKAADIYMHIADKKILQSIPNEGLKEIAEAFHIDYRKGIID